MNLLRWGDGGISEGVKAEQSPPLPVDCSRRSDCWGGGGHFVVTLSSWPETSAECSARESRPPRRASVRSEVLFSAERDPRREPHPGFRRLSDHHPDFLPLKWKIWSSVTQIIIMILIPSSSQSSCSCTSWKGNQDNNVIGFLTAFNPIHSSILSHTYSPCCVLPHLNL